MCQITRALATVAIGFAVLVPSVASGTEIPAAVEGYAASWKSFYPSAALRQGFLGSIAEIEDYSSASIHEWIELNRSALAEIDELLEGDLTLDDRIDARLLRTQVRKELDRFLNDRPQEHSLGFYADRIARALGPILESSRHSATERSRLLEQRLEGVARLADAARANLTNGRPQATREAVEKLRRFSVPPESNGVSEEFVTTADSAAEAVERLARHVEEELLPSLTLPDEPILGRDAYAAKLKIYTDSDLTPDELERRALAEIRASKAALAELSTAYWRATYPDEPLPEDPADRVARGFADLEANRPTAEQEYLEELRRYGREVEAFVRDHEITSVPDNNTLSIELAPESSGPMARIGFVRSAPPFHPNPWTTWYLATIPDSHPEQERIDFWRSFNYSFKRFIVIHELYPGHYLQLKVMRENPHLARVLFPYRPFIEGWATFSERIVLDAGYAGGDWLTRLAQLRKRLENANRAYTSVQAHCRGWSEDQVFDFSVETSLLAPQFAKSLWGRLMRSPMQILTYMLMGIELREIYEAEVERLGERFVLRDFMDTVLRTGPVPGDTLVEVLRAEMP